MPLSVPHGFRISRPALLIALVALIASGQTAAQPTKPLDLGFEAGQPGNPPADWSVPTPGWKAELTESNAAEGKLSARLTKPAESTSKVGNLMLAEWLRKTGADGRKVIDAYRAM